uniref:7TM_GPCR_Srx domain-containing protein n=1 Tax=Caenorhabditis tropicalis TaxID=1561998 RepID=A0A1I7TL68_9PELO
MFLCAFTLYPAMDAIIALHVVSDYRKAAKSDCQRPVITKLNHFRNANNSLCFIGLILQIERFQTKEFADFVK